MRELVRVGVVGTGGMGGRHARNLAQRVTGADITAIMDPDETRAAAVARECGGARVFSDGVELIRDEAVDAVVIASPDHTHAALATACIAAGKPALCEKPLATNLDDAARVLDAESVLARRLIQVGFMRVCDPKHLAFREAVAGGDYGRPLMFRGVHANLALLEPRTARDVIVNSAVHDFHSLRWIMGAEAAVVSAHVVPAGEGLADTCRLLLVQMTLENGAVASIEVNSASGYGYEVAVEVTCERGVVRMPAPATPIVSHDGQRGSEIAPDWLVRFETAYLLEAQEWVHRVAKGTAGGPSVWDGYASLAIADACIRSVEAEAPQRVTLPDRPALYGDG